jgi:NO-binding membrane sensor protein with MHYT domain/signal transduction histidine kinase
MAAVNLIGSYNYALVALSVLIAIFASYAALDLAGRVTAARGWTRAVWLLGGAGAMGTGIWSMHYIGMLAFILPIPVAYHWPTVLLSLFAAILASVIALYVVSRQKMGASRAVAGSVLMGAGISSMHYIGMAAMRLPALCQFNSFLVVLSVVFAVLISLAALWITFQFRDEKTGIGREKLAGAVVMGAAIPVMHYTGMAAASFTPSGMSADLSHAVSISALGTAGIAAVTFIVLGLALLTSWVDRRFAVRILELQEKKLQRSEAYLAEAQRLSHTGSFGWRVAAGEIIWSEETFRIFQYDRTTKPTVELLLQRVHPDDAALVKQTIERASQDGKNFEHEYRLLMPDSSVKYVRVVAHALSDESGSVEFVGAVMDVTERRRAVALRDGESRILEMTARDARLEDTLETLVHFVEAQFAGLLCSVLLLDEDGEHVRHGAAPNLPKAYSEAIDGLSIGPKAGSCGTAMYRREPVVVIDILQDPLWEDYRDVAGRYGLRACWSTPILSHSGKALGSFAMYFREPRNPSPAETSALEMATHLAGIAIERKLAREERERLRQAQADLAHINRVTTMGELTASLAHEIKQPITAAVTDAKTCVRWLRRDEPDVAEACEAASRVVTDVTRAADIISRISSLFKKGALRHEFVDLNELIQEMIALLRSEAARYSILIRSELAEGLPNIMAERVQLQQVFMNLMLNGIDAMKDVCTAGELTIKSQQLKDDQLLVSVSDTGVGLPQLESEKMFNAFFTTKAHGTGMGLPISRSIIESHGGRLWASSNSGRGASFHFTLPNKGQSHTASAQGDVSQSA